MLYEIGLITFCEFRRLPPNRIVIERRVGETRLSPVCTRARADAPRDAVRGVGVDLRQIWSDQIPMTSSMKTIAVAVVGFSTMQGAADAQSYADRRPVVVYHQNNTGGGTDRVISYGPTGADTVSTNSAAGGNAGRPELAVPNGSAGGGSSR